MGGRQAVRPRTLDPVSKVRILPAQPVIRSYLGAENHDCYTIVSSSRRRSMVNGAGCFDRRELGGVDMGTARQGVRTVRL
jgi:hypothetical protein